MTIRDRSLALVVLALALAPPLARAQPPTTTDAVVPEVVPPLPPEPPVDRSGPTVTEAALLDRWINESPEVLSWRTEIGAARFDVVTASLFPNPYVQVSSLSTHQGFVPPDSQFNFLVQVQQELPVLGQISARVDEASAVLRATELDVMVQVWSGYAGLRSAMVARAFADEASRMYEHNLTELDRIIGIVTARASAGAIPRYDLLRVQLTAVTMRANLRESLLDRRTAEGQIVSMLAVPGVDTAPVERAGLMPITYPAVESELIELAIARRPDLEQARRQATASRASAARQRAEVVPIPSIWVGSYMGASTYSSSLVGGIQMPIPIFDQNQGDIGNAEADAAGFDDEAQALDARIRIEVVQASRRVTEARAALDSFGQGVTLSEEVIRLAEVSYQGGRFMIADLFDAYGALWDARMEELQLQQELAEAEVELGRAAALFEVPGAVAVAPSASSSSEGGSR
jgi:cobalt-zinc-cadmium efflux system outer membrane protein